MTKRDERAKIIAGLRANGMEAIYGKGGFWIRGQGFVSFAKARKLAGVVVSEELKRGPAMEQLPWGEYATVAMFNGR